jgi:peptidoglycan/LPS O-acetylase OafA/YrhL
VLKTSPEAVPAAAKAISPGAGYLSPSLSSYLDGVRFVAAVAVMMGHMVQDGFGIGWVPIAHASHEAVVLFFVLSGLIIHGTTFRRHPNWQDYAVARLSRVYSVALPAVVFCTLGSIVFAILRPDLLPRLPAYRPASLIDFLCSVFFLNESWSSLRTPTRLTLNGPYWTLCFEVWYYILFGLFVFMRSRWRWPILIIAGIVTGLNALLLLPVWLLGAWLSARGARLPTLSGERAWGAFLVAPLLIAGIVASDVDHAIKNALHGSIPGFWRLEGSQRFLTDYLIGVAVVLNIHAFKGLGPVVAAAFERWQPTLQRLAGFSFTVYLFHQPLLDLTRLFLPKWVASAGGGALAVAAYLFLCWVISLVTERQLPWWRRTIGNVLGGTRSVQAPGAVHKSSTR